MSRLEQRVSGAVAGLLIGDALAMPVHWYYDREALRREYGEVRDFVAPRSPHSGSIMWRSHYQALSPKGEILHDKAPYWGQRGVHYHGFLRAGENTLTAQLARLVLEMGSDGYSLEEYTRRYIDYLTTPGRHNDTYLEECHRGFFTNYARGKAPSECAIEEKHIGGLTPMLAVALLSPRDRAQGLERGLAHLALTHAGAKMKEAGRLILNLLYDVLEGHGLKAALESRIAEQRSPLLGHPFRAWLSMTDEQVVGACLSTACYLPDSAVLYLALKYHDRPEDGLVANTNLGGENVHRGSVLGCLLGAENGLSGWPERWVQGLHAPLPTL